MENKESERRTILCFVVGSIVGVGVVGGLTEQIMCTKDFYKAMSETFNKQWAKRGYETNEVEVEAIISMVLKFEKEAKPTGGYIL